jgi:hypothetical protein
LIRWLRIYADNRFPVQIKAIHREKRIISNLVEMNMDFFSEKLLLSMGSASRENQVWSRGPLPGQKIISRVSPDQKRRSFLFSKCGLPRFQPGYPFATAFLSGNFMGAWSNRGKAQLRMLEGNTFGDDCQSGISK